MGLLANSLLLAQDVGEPALLGPRLAPPMSTSAVPQPYYQPAPVQPFPCQQEPFAQPTFRWGWFGAERYHARAKWHYDYQRSAMRWKYYR